LNTVEKKLNPKMMFLKQVEKISTIVPKNNEFPEPSDNYVSSAGLTCSFFNSSFSPILSRISRGKFLEI